ncbi:MAG: NAD(P)H-hydrate dehydratase [Bdellovibrionales bacterium]|nr:NAD(P)H-hydrate dehydratase [Bdellovibrionales bacterium]
MFRKSFIPLSSKEQSRELDRQAASWNLTGEFLMENAGRVSATEASRLFPSRSFLILCGSGNNGGDGWVMARYLRELGKSVSVFSTESLSELSKRNGDQAIKMGVPSHPLQELCAEDLKNQIVVDALFGVGLSRPVEGVFAQAISLVNASKEAVISLDIPSGLCGNTGQILGEAVKADHTFSYGLGKPGFYIGKGPGLAGQIQVFPIGFPDELLSKVCDTFFLVEKNTVSLPVYEDEANKSHRGHTLICAGREGFWGSGILACQGAFIAGSGYVTWAGQGLPDIIKIPEVLTVNIKDSKILYKKTSVAIGPGIGIEKSVGDLIRLLKDQDQPVVLDADALTFLSQNTSLFPLNFHFVLTPHTGELSRILAVSSEEIGRDRLRFAREGAKQTGSWIVLKGFHTVVSDGNKCWIVNSGNSALGKAGTGDVLTGLIAGFLAQGLSVRDGALLAVAAHGETAEEWCRSGRDVNSFSASEALRLLPSVLFKMRQNAG